jgi:hypothetical protein
MMDWPMTRHVERRASRLNEMIERINVNPLELARLDQGQAYIEAFKICIECHHAPSCLRWLESEPQSGEKADFCPNYPLLDSVKRR